MKKTLFLLLFASLFATEPLLEIKGGYFFFTNAKMNKAYKRGGADLQLAFSYPLRPRVELYSSVEYLYRKGTPTPGFHSTFQCVPLNLGLKWILPSSSPVRYYIAIGPRYAFAFTSTNYPYVNQHLSQSGFGGFLSTGFLFQPRPHFNINLFGDYAYQVMRFHPTKPNVTSSSTQIGGLVFGVGLGYLF